MSIKASLSLDNSEFKKGMQDAEKTATSSMNKMSSGTNKMSSAMKTFVNMGGAGNGVISKLVTGLGKLGPVGLGVAAAFVGIGLAAKGVINWIGNLTRRVDETVKAAESVNMTANAFLQLQYAARLAGISSEKLIKAISKLDDAVSKARAGDEKYRAAFDAIGASWRELSTLSPEQQLTRISTRLAELKRAGQDVPAIFKEIMGQKTMRDLNQAAENDFAKNLAIAQASGIKISDEMQKAAQQYNDEVAKTKSTWDAVITNLKVSLGLTKALIGFQKILRGVITSDLRPSNSSEFERDEITGRKVFSGDYISVADVAESHLQNINIFDDYLLQATNDIKNVLLKSAEQQAINENLDLMMSQGVNPRNLPPITNNPNFRAEVDKLNGLTPLQIAQEFARKYQGVDWSSLSNSEQDFLYEVLKNKDKRLQSYNRSDENTWVVPINELERGRRERYNLRKFFRSGAEQLDAAGTSGSHLKDFIDLMGTAENKKELENFVTELNKAFGSDIVDKIFNVPDSELKNKEFGKNFFENIAKYMDFSDVPEPVREKVQSAVQKFITKTQADIISRKGIEGQQSEWKTIDSLNKKADELDAQNKLQHAIILMDDQEIERLREINALRAAGVEITEDNLKKYKDYVSNLLEAENRQKELQFGDNMLSQVKNLGDTAMEKLGFGLEAAINRAITSAQNALGRPLIGSERELVEDKARLDWRINHWRMPDDRNDVIHTNELARRGGFNSSVVVEKNDATSKQLAALKRMQELLSRSNEIQTQIKEGMYI